MRWLIGGFILLYGFAFAETRVIVVEGIACSACVKNVKKALKNIEGVSEVKYDEKKGVFLVKAEGEISEDVVRKAVEDAGYKFKKMKEVSYE